MRLAIALLSGLAGAVIGLGVALLVIGQLENIERLGRNQESTRMDIEHLKQEQAGIKNILLSVGILEQTEGGGLRPRRAKRPLAGAPEGGTKGLQSVDKRVDEPGNM